MKYYLLMKTVSLPCLALSALLLISCAGMKNPEKPELPEDAGGRFFETCDNLNIYVYDTAPRSSGTSIYILSGYTGINHESESDVISMLSDSGLNRVVVIHPRGTGYSDGTRGDVGDYRDFLADFTAVINDDVSSGRAGGRVVLFGHSISSAVCLAVSGSLERTDGIILVNPPVRLKNSPGMSPAVSDYIRYAGYMIFARHKPVVNMAGNPDLIENPQERAEALRRCGDPLLVKYISMYMMLESKKILDAMPGAAGGIEAPLLLVYGTADSIIEKSGCDLVYGKWKSEKEYVIIEDGPHGKQTVLRASDEIRAWLSELSG